MQDTSNTTSLQPQGLGGIQNGAGGLQQQSQNAATNQSATTGQPQQDALGQSSLTGVENLTVQGPTVVTSPQVTSGRGSYDVFFVFLFGILVVLAYVAFRTYKKSLIVSEDSTAKTVLRKSNDVKKEPEPTPLPEKSQNKKLVKKRTNAVKPIKKSKAKSKAKAKSKKKK